MNDGNLPHRSPETMKLPLSLSSLLSLCVLRSLSPASRHGVEQNASPKQLKVDLHFVRKNCALYRMPQLSLFLSEWGTVFVVTPNPKWYNSLSFSFCLFLPFFKKPYAKGKRKFIYRSLMKFNMFYQ